MELSAGLISWAIGIIVLAGFIDCKIIDWTENKVASYMRDKVLCEPLIFEPGDKLKSAKLD